MDPQTSEYRSSVGQLMAKNFGTLCPSPAQPHGSRSSWSRSYWPLPAVVQKVWIGEIQWMIRRGWGFPSRPILKDLGNIQCRDAVLNEDGTEAQWPATDVIIGNPPFLGDKGMLGVLGELYTHRLRKVYDGRVPGNADLVSYWFEKARASLADRQAFRVGLVATNSIRAGGSRQVLDRIASTGRITDAWPDEPWAVDGAAVRVSVVCFATPEHVGPMHLNGHQALTINPDLTTDLDLTKAKRLAQNAGIAFQGPVKVGPFDIPGDLAREWLSLPLNPNGRPNVDVIRPWMNGNDITRRPSDTWIVQFGNLAEAEAALYEQPFEYVRRTVKLVRANNRDRQRRENWWRLGRSGQALAEINKGKARYIATPRIAKHRLFVWLDSIILPDCQLVVIARDDDITFGILHSRFHELWTLRLSSWLGAGNDPRYTPSTTFETFPFPSVMPASGWTQVVSNNPAAAAITQAARNLDQLRNNWLNPSDLVYRVPEVVRDYPDRLLPVSSEAASHLKRRTLTRLYNERPAWLDRAHRDLDAAVAAAYGWSADISDDEALARLLDLNRQREPYTGRARKKAGQSKQGHLMLALPGGRGHATADHQADVQGEQQRNRTVSAGS